MLFLVIVFWEVFEMVTESIELLLTEMILQSQQGSGYLELHYFCILDWILKPSFCRTAVLTLYVISKHFSK